MTLARKWSLATRGAVQNGRLAWQSPRALLAVLRVKRAKLTYLQERALLDLALAAKAADRRGIQGIFLEAGTALGGSAIVLAAAKDARRWLRAYDTFGMIPPPSGGDGADVHDRYQIIAAGNARGIGGQDYYGYRDDLIEDVRRAFDTLGYNVGTNHVELVQGLFQETMVGEEPVALAHLDGDWYESTLFCLNQIAPRMPAGGRFVIDDYDDWSGCRKAVDEFLASSIGDNFQAHRELRLHLERVR